jgi:glycosyltransferase involved in cell wall biosynthesis
MRLAVVASHPIQYQAPLFRKLANSVELMVYYAHNPTSEEQARAGFSVGFNWDVDLLSGYPHRFLKNVSSVPGLTFWGCDTPDVGLLLKEGQFDAVLVLGWYLKSFVQAVWSCRRQGIPVMVRGDNNLLEPRSRSKRLLKWLLYPILLRAFDAVLFVGERSREYFQHYSYPNERLFFAPHGVDEAAFLKAEYTKAGDYIRELLGIADNDTVVLFAGKLIKRKRVQDLLVASKICEERGARLHVIVAGSGPLEGDLRCLASRLGVRVHFMGFQNQSRIPAIYAASTIMVLPSDNESWGLVANEALACRRPIVLSSAVGSAPDLAGDGRAGRVFRVGDCQHLAEMLLDVLRRPPDPEELQRKSNKYNTDACASGILDACAFVTSGRQRGEQMGSTKLVERG